jgi:hypothetical protein
MSQRQPVVLNAGQLQQLQAADYANIGIPYFMHKNRVLNGNFNIWQRGTALSTITTTSTYYPDQWRADFDGTGTNLSIERMSFSPGQTSVPDNPLYYLEASVSIAATGQTVLALDQRIESCFTFSGQTATVSFWAKADTSRTLSVRLDRYYGSGGSPSSADIGLAGGAQSFSLTTSWQKFTATFSIPSISGKTLGTNGDDWISVLFLFPINSGFTIDIAHVQFEQGSNATQFEYRPYAIELALCQRYFESIVAGSGYGPLATGGWVSGGAPNYVGIAFARFASKRTIPTVTFPDPAGNYYMNVATNGQVSTAMSAVGAGTLTSWAIEGTPSTPLTPGQACVIESYNTDTARLWISAEL